MRGETGRNLLLAVPSGGLAIALTTQITALSWLLQTRFGLAIDDIALVWAAGPLAGIVGQLAVGHASDRTWALGGRRRPYLIMSGILTSCALAALLQLGAIARLFGGVPLVVLAGAIALVLDVAINVGLNPARALIADVVPEGRPRSLAFAWMQTVSGVLGVGITLVGAVLGNAMMMATAALLTLPLTALPGLMVREPRTLTAISEGPKLTVALALAMLLPIAPAAAFALFAATLHLAGARTDMQPWALATLALTAIVGIASFRSADRSQTGLARRTFLAQGLSWVGIFSMFVFLAPVVSERLPQLDGEAAGRAIAIALGLFNLVAAVAPLLLLMPRTRRFRRAQVHAAAMALMAAAFWAIGTRITTVEALWLCMALAGIGWGSLVSLPYVIFCDRVDAGQLGLFLGLFNLSVVIPQLVVSLGLGAIAPTLAARGDLFVIAALALLASALAWSQIPPLPRTESPR
jgi:maltose/moltooligosaccharide transporter